MRVQTGDQVGIGGFIITGTAPKHVLLRAIGPSLTGSGVPNALADPVLELHGPGAFTTVTNDNWRDDPVQEAAILATGVPPGNDLESAIDISLNPGAYTAIVRGKNNTSGVALIEVYDLAQSVGKLANISTRAFVSTGDNIVIGGFLLGGHNGNTRIVVRGIGPSLVSIGSGFMDDPTLALRDGNGSLVLANNDWQDDPAQAATLIAAGLAPTNDLEAGLATTLSPGLYTALLAGRNNGTGLGLVEVYDLGDGSGSPTPTPAPSPTPTPSEPPNPTPSASPNPTPPASPSPFPTPSPTPNPTATATGSPAPSPTPALSPTPTPTPCSGTAFPENFDGVTPPALPQGWGTSGSGNFQWVTSTTTPDTAPNDAFLPDQDGVSDTLLSSPAFVITSSSAVLSFRNNFNMEFSDGTYWDGCVLEVSSPNINAGAFTDITDPAVGGSFVTGGYTGVIGDTASNPLADRMAWVGNSGGYIDTVVNLGPNVDGQTIRLRFRMGTDQAVAAPGWRIDTITLVGGGACPSPTPTPTPTPPCGISDGGFENGGIPSTIWNNPQTSTNFGSPLCDFNLCGNGGGASPPRTGLVWSWFGGISAPETATLGQDVTIPSGGSAALHFWMRIGTVNTPFTDVLNVRVDGGVVQSYPEPAVAEADYTERVIDLSAFADGATHNIEFEYIGPSSGVGSYVVDDVSLVSNNACPTPSPSASVGTPSPTPSCPPTITESSTQTITPLNSVGCNNGTGHTDNSYWRAFTMTSFVGSNSYNVTSVSFGIEQATGAGGTQPITVRLHTSNQPFPTGFPGSLTQIATASVNVPDSASNTIFTVPIVATVPAGAQLVMEVFTPDGTVAGNLLFIGSNADPESAPSYLSAAACGITMPTTTAAIGFPNMHIVFNVNASCGNVTPTPTATVAPSPTPTATATVAPTPTPTPSPVCPWSFGPPLPAVAGVRAPGNYFAANGRFYFIGGRSADVAGSDFTHPFEYNPATNTWTTKPSTLPDNKVNNMACGVLTVSGTPQIFCVGGNASQVVGTASRVFSYNPATDTFTTLAAGDDWPGSQAGGFLPGGFAVLGNKLYTIGSFNANSAPPVVTNQVWRFDPTAAVGSKWLALANYPVARGYIPAASIGSFIYTGGGSNVDAGGALIDTADSFRYDPASNTWSVIANIPRATGETRAVVMGNKMLVLGGGRTAPNPSNEVDSYDPVTNTWSIVPHFVTPRRNFAADSDGSSRLWLVGGYDSSGTMLLNTMEIFGPPNCP